MKRATVERSEYIQNQIRRYEKAIEENRYTEWRILIHLRGAYWDPAHGYKAWGRRLVQIREERIALTTQYENCVCYWYGNKLNNK